MKTQQEAFQLRYCFICSIVLIVFVGATLMKFSSSNPVELMKLSKDHLYIHSEGIKRSSDIKESSKDIKERTSQSIIKEHLPNVATQVDEHLEERIAMMAAEALLEIENDEKNGKACIPVVCNKPNHFFTEKDNIHNFTFLNTFPGSGNTWLRSVIREGTRVWTGSAYNDDSIAEKGYLGELKPAHTDTTITSVIKSHFTPRSILQDFDRNVTALINIIRCPLDATLAEYNRQGGRSHTKEARVPVSASFMRKWVRDWVEFHRGFRQLDLVYPAEHRPIRTIKDYMKIEYRRLSPGKLAVPVLTMFYEDFVLNERKATSYLFAFLKTQYSNFVPTVKESLICAAHYAKAQEIFHRHHKAPIRTPLYNDQTGTTATGASVCKLAEDYWNRDKWGVCDGRLLSQTNILKNKEPFLPKIDKYPKCR